MNQKVVILGGGTGMSTLLKGLKYFPVDITAIVSVCDDGKSTGRLRKEFDIVAVGDLRKVLVSLAETEPLVEDVLNYRFQTTSDLDGHTVGNLLLTAMSNITGNVSDGIEALAKLLNLKGRVLPLTEEKVTLVGHMKDGTTVYGEHFITECNKEIESVEYLEEPIATKEVLESIQEADLVILSMGSLYTSIIPNLICKGIPEAIDQSKAKIMYICNMMTQPGETDHYTVNDHVKILNEYLGKKKINVVIANDGPISGEIKERYSTLEQKDEVKLDIDQIKDTNVELIHSDYVTVENNMIRHNVNKLALDIFAYLLR